MANAFNTNPFYTLESDSHKLGFLKSTTPTSTTLSTGGTRHSMEMNFSNDNVDVRPALTSQNYKTLTVNTRNAGSEREGLTNYTIEFVTNPYYVKTDGVQSSKINFLNAISDDEISNLLNQLDFSKLNSSNASSNNLGRFYNDIKATLDAFPQSLLVGPQSSAVNTALDSIDKQNQIIAAYEAPDNGTVSPQDRPTSSEYNKAKTELAKANTQIEVLKDFELTGGTFLSKIVRDKVEINFRSFQTRFTDQFNYVYQDLVTSGAINNESERKKSGSKTLVASSGTSTSAGLGVDPNQRAIENSSNLILGSNQILVTEASGTNVFGSHQPFDQIMSVLDVMRNENGGVPYTSDINVKNNITPSEALAEDPTVCSQLWAYFSISDLNLMKAALEAKAAYDKINLTEKFMTLKKMVGSKTMAFISAITGFSGLDFSKIDFSNLGDFNFDPVLKGIDAAISKIESLTISDIGGPFALAIMKVTGAISDKTALLYAATIASANAVDFQKMFNQIDPHILVQCPTISQIKDLMQNPDSIVTKEFAKTKQVLVVELKQYKAKINEMQATAAKTKEIQIQVDKLKAVIATKVP